MALTDTDLKQIKGLMSGLATKSDLDRFATKADLSSAVGPLATKKDLDRMEARLVASMSLIERDAFTRLDDHEVRIAKLEKSAGVELAAVLHMIERIVNPETTDSAEAAEELALVETLRPKTFASYIGQPLLKQNLQLAIDAAKVRDEPVEHVLLYGPPGLGKTTMAGVIAHELDANIRVTSGPAIERAGDLASLLTALEDGDVLFIDEIHRLPKTVEEVLYPAMEDFGLDVMLGKGPSAKSIRLDLHKFTIIGATTRAGALSAPLRDRFGHVHRLEFYSNDEMLQIIERAARILEVKLGREAAEEIASRARLTPRIANRLLKRVRDYAQVHQVDTITRRDAREALHLLEIDDLGLDTSDRRLLQAIIEHYAGGPVGLTTLAAICAEETTTIEDVYEPYLMQIGLLERTSRGRRATLKAYAHLGLTPPASP